MQCSPRTLSQAWGFPHVRLATPQYIYETLLLVLAWFNLDPVHVNTQVGTHTYISLFCQLRGPGSNDTPVATRAPSA